MSMPVCDVRPDNTRAMGVAVGEDVVRQHGRKTFVTRLICR